MKKYIFAIIFFGNFIIKLHAPLIQKNLTLRQRLLIYLRQQCYMYNLEYRKMKAQMLAESNFKFDCTEIKNHRMISFGLFQICYDTLEMYLKAKRKKMIKYNYYKRKYLYNPWNNISVATWNMRLLLNYYNESYLKAFSAHNMGITGFNNYMRRTGIKYYWRYINLLNKKGARL